MAGANITSGMDIQAVKTLGTNLGTKASEIETIMTTVDGFIRDMAWVGADATAFSSKWESEGKRALTAAKQILTDAGTAATKNASQQETTSTASGDGFA